MTARTRLEAIVLAVVRLQLVAMEVLQAVDMVAAINSKDLQAAMAVLQVKVATVKARQADTTVHHLRNLNISSRDMASSSNMAEDMVHNHHHLLVTEHTQAGNGIVART